MAKSHGWHLEGISIRELIPPEGSLDPDEQNTMFHPSEVELASTTQLILSDVERLKPARVVFDSLSELRLLAGTALRYRRQILAPQAVFRDPRLHRGPPRRHDGDRPRSPDAEHRARRRAAGTTAARFWGGAAPAADCQIPRRQVSWRLSRLRDSTRRAPGVPATGRRRTPAAHHPREAAQRYRRARCAARRGHRRRDQHAHRWRRRNRQIDTGGPIRRRRGVSRPTRGALHLRREPRHADDSLPRVGRRVARARRSRSCHAPAGRSRRAHTGRVRSSRSEPASRRKMRR